MTIVVPGVIFPDSFVRNIVVTLEAMGHKVVNVRTARHYHHQNRILHTFWKYLPLAVPSLERAAWNNLVKTVAKLQPDLVLLTYGVPPQVLRDIRVACGAKIVCWFTDPVANYYRGYLIAGSYDALFIKEPFLVPLLREKLEINAYYLPEACNPLWHTPVELTEQDRKEFGCELAAIGSLHYYRARMLEPFLSHDLRIWGSNCPLWIDSSAREKYQGKYVAEHIKAKSLRAADIVLNTMHYAEVDGVNCTLFEAAGCGAFQIADWKPALPALFEPETEIVTFRTRADLKDKVSYYLAHAQERLAIALRARQRAHRDHTYEQRLSAILSVVGLAPVTHSPSLELALGSSQ